MAFAREGSGRVAVSFIGEGGTSLGEWHEAINLCAARRLPAIFCVENNQTALSTPGRRAVGRARLRRQGGGLRHPRHHDRRHRPGRDRRGVRLGGRAGARGHGPDAHRARLHAHVRPRAPRRHALSRQGAAALLGLSAARREAATPTASSSSTGRAAIRSPPTPRASRRRASSQRGDLERLQARGRGARRERGPPRDRRAVARAASSPARASSPASRRARASSRSIPRAAATAADASFRRSSRVRPFDPKGKTFLEAVMPGRRRRAARRPARLRLRRGRRRQVRQRVPAAAAAARRSSATGSSTRRSPRARSSASASARRSPASGRSARCSSTTSSRPASTSSSTTPRRSATAGAARCRWSCACRGAGCATPGPYHSQNTEAWFYRTPGLKIVVPSTPHDARALMAVGRRRSGSGPLLRAHRALPRPAHQAGARRTRAPAPIPLGKAALRRAGRRPRDRLLRRLRPRRAARGREARDATASRPPCSTCAPSRRSTATALLAVAAPLRPRPRSSTRTRAPAASARASPPSSRKRRSSRSTRPVRIVGALDTPVPYSPPLEEFFLPSEEPIERAARLLAAY